VAFSQAIEHGSHFDQLPSVAGVNYESGWRFETEYWDLQNRIHRDDFRQELILPNRPTYYPITMAGNVMQGYFFPFDDAGLRIVLNHLHVQDQEGIPEWLRGLVQ
jgi:hypothetical protein